MLDPGRPKNRMLHPGPSQPGCLIPVARETTSTRAGAPRGASPRLFAFTGPRVRGERGGRAGPRRPASLPGVRPSGGRPGDGPWPGLAGDAGLPRAPEAPGGEGRPHPPVLLAASSDAPRATVTPGAAAPQGPEGAVVPATPLADGLVTRPQGEPPLRPIARTTGRCLDEDGRCGEDKGGAGNGEKQPALFREAAGKALGIKELGVGDGGTGVKLSPGAGLASRDARWNHRPSCPGLSRASTNFLRTAVVTSWMPATRAGMTRSWPDVPRPISAKPHPSALTAPLSISISRMSFFGTLP